MEILVKKFGGTSLADITKINRAIDHVKNGINKGYSVVVVVSAMGKETNRLFSLDDKLEEYEKSDDISALISSGEQISSSFFSIILNKKGVRARSFQGWQIPIITEKNVINSKIKDIKTEKIRKSLKLNQVPVISGFQGVNDEERITTLGRGGSDTTAVALAAKLKATRCDIYTDVDGVYSADPRIVPEAKKMTKINFEEMLELSSLGAKVLHTRSVQIALKYNVKVQVLSSLKGKNGTMLINEDRSLESQIIRGIAHNSNDALVTLIGVKNEPGISALIFNALSKQSINVDMIVQSGSSLDKEVTFGFTINKADVSKTKTIMQNLKEKLSIKKIIVNTSICKVSVVGLGMKTNAGIANKMFSELAKNNINIHVISTSEIKISVLIDDKYKELAIRSLHQKFKLSSSRKKNVR